jgi:hypothetical protein
LTCISFGLLLGENVKLNIVVQNSVVCVGQSLSYEQKMLVMRMNTYFWLKYNVSFKRFDLNPCISMINIKLSYPDIIPYSDHSVCARGLKGVPPLPALLFLTNKWVRDILPENCIILHMLTNS